MLEHLRSCCVLVLLAAPPLVAQDANEPARSPLSLQFEQLTMSTRTEGPVLVGVTLDPHISGPLEGTLELELYDTGTRVLTLHIPDIFLQGNRYETTIVLPPLPPTYGGSTGSSLSGLDLNAVFATKAGRYLLSDRTASSNEQAGTLLVTPHHQRGMTIGMVCGRRPSKRTPSQEFVSKQLSFDAYAKPKVNPYESGDQRIRRMQNVQVPTTGTMCSAWTIVADQLPANPLALCAFNVLLLSDGGLASLTTQQADAIRQWVRAGGSICVCTDGELERQDSAFLAEMCSENKEGQSFAINANGEMIGLEEHEIVRASYGLGAVVVFGPASDLTALHTQRIAEYDTEMRKVANTFIRDANASVPLSDRMSGRVNAVLDKWHRGEGEALFDRYRDQQAQLQSTAGFLWHVKANRVGENGWLTRSRNGTNQWGRQWGYTLQGVAPVGSHSEGLVEQLMPKGVKMVPISYVGAILLAYIFLVGPGDYFLLGLLKMRRYTWVVFPIVTVLFTTGLVLLSNRYMSTTETGGEIEICDIAGTQIARRTTIGLEFYGNRRETSVDRGRTLYTPVSTSQQNNYWTGGAWSNTAMLENAETEDDNLYYLGRVGSQYSTHRVVPQWDPRLNRSLEIVADEPAPECGFDWNSPGDLLSTEGRFEFGEAVRKWNEDAAVSVYNAGTCHVVRRSMPSMGSERYGRGSDEYNAGFVANMNQSVVGVLNYVSRLAPHGGASFEDLPMVDATDKNECLLVVAWVEGNKQLIYRKRYRIEPPMETRKPQ